MQNKIKNNIEVRSLKVNINMATFNNRDITPTLNSLKKAIKYHQAVSNEFEFEYEFKINIYNNDLITNYTDNAKFKYLDCDILFTVDDDIIYPEDYIYIMINQVFRYGVVTCHGRILKDFERYYGPTQSIFHCKRRTEFSKLDILGTGVSCFGMTESVSEALKTILNSDDQMMTDVIVSLELSKRNIYIYCIEHKANWIKLIDNDDGCYNTMTTKQERLVELIQHWKK